MLFFGLLAARRWSQLASPQVWDEDGYIISGFISNGWREFLQPINGYLVLVPMLISKASLAASIYYYPFISTLLAWVFIALVGLAVAKAPTHLRGRFLCAVSIFLIPSNPETFGLPLYTFWWASILLLLVALWDERRPHLWLRLALLVAGGFSSPFILVILPPLYFRAFRHRTRAETAVALAATGIAAIQIYFVSTGAANAGTSLASVLQDVVPKFCGWFLVGNLSEHRYLLWPMGILVLALVARWALGNRRNPMAWIIVFLYCGAIASSVYRNDASILHPALAGPRYFFLPFILTFWILVQLLLSADMGWIRFAAGIAILTGVLNALPVRTRQHDDLQWAEHLRSARLFHDYEVPIECDGRRFTAWSIDESGATWDRLVRRDRLVSAGRLAELPTFAYRVVNPNKVDGGQNPAARNDRDARGRGPVISFVPTVSGGGNVLLTFGAGRRIRFRSGPVPARPCMAVIGHEKAYIASLPITEDWVTLEFSNSSLPKEFTIEIKDRGQGVGEWSAL